MNPSQTQHPTDQALQVYGLGKLDDDSAESVNKHVESCSDCQRRVAELSSDSFLGRLRNVQGGPDSPGHAMSATAARSAPETAPVAAAPPAASTLPPGLADHPDYEITRELGRGGMGVVYLAQNKIMGRPEVLKVVSGHLINRRGVVDRFLAEIRNAARLRHPNIVTAYSVVRVGDSLILAMEHVDGLDLTKLVQARGPLPVTHACNYVHQAALGLQHAHERGMVHRDIKPSNLMLARQDNRASIKLLDFGLAKVQSEGAVDGGLTHEGQMLGTPDFIAPEQISDARRSDIRADIYSLGCTLYYLLTGGPPFQATSLYEILQAHHSMDALPLNLARPEVPVELAALVARMMAKEPERRFQQPKDVAQALVPFFKKGIASARVPNAEISQPGQTETKPNDISTSAASRPTASKPASTRPQSRKTPALKEQPDSIWNSLLEMEQAEPARVPVPGVTPVRSTSKRPTPPWIWPSVAAGILLLGFVVASQMSVRVKTANGMIELLALPKDAEVAVDGERVEVRWSDSGERAIITVSPGKHKIIVKKDGVELSGEEVTVKPDGKEKVTVRLIASEPPAPAKEQPVAVAVTANMKAVNDALEMPIPMKFPEDTPLEGMLKHIKERTKGSLKSGIPVYVEPRGLQEAHKSMSSTTRFNVENLALKVTLRQLLGKIDLAYVVKDGLVLISSDKGMERTSKEGPVWFADKEPATRRLMHLLEESIPMHFEEDTPVEDVLEYIKKTTNGAFQYDVDQAGLKEAVKSMSSTVRNLDVEGVPLRTTLRVLLKQLELDYLVQDGFAIITSGASVVRRQKGPTAPPKASADSKAGKTDAVDRVENEPAQTPATEAAQALMGKAEFTLGSWVAEGRELVQNGGGGRVLFGDLRWTDYDFTVDLLREKGSKDDDCNLIFRRITRNDNRLVFGTSSRGEGICEIRAFTDGEELRIKGVERRLVDRKWYHARVSVRRNHIVCTLHDDGGNEVVHLEGNDDRCSNGQVGLAVWESSCRFKNIKVTAPDGKILWEMPPAIGEAPNRPMATVPDNSKINPTAALDKKDGKRNAAARVANEPARTQATDAALALKGKAEILSGRWLVEGRELVQTRAVMGGEGGAVLFGDLHWTDFDFTVDLRRENGDQGAALRFRNTIRNDNRLIFGISRGDSGEETCTIEAIEDGTGRTLREVGSRLVNHKWYRARVSVRGDHIVCTLHDDAGKKVVELDAKDDRHPSGRVALATENSSYRFKNIKVTAPDGKTLWEIPPAIGELPGRARDKGATR